MPPADPNQDTHEPAQDDKLFKVVTSSDELTSGASSGKRTLAFGLVALLVIAVAAEGFTLLSGTGTKPTTAPATASISHPIPTDVSITSSGFMPATVSIKVGQAVSWTNNDSSPHWVASDPYPTDDGLTGFNSRQALQLGDTYSFVFNKAGTYTYHDQLNPYSLKGSVVVR